MFLIFGVGEQGKGPKVFKRTSATWRERKNNFVANV
jgi:hypothetical protein